MPTLILFDPPQWLYLLLGGLLVVTAGVAAQKRDKRVTIAFGVAFLLVVLVFLIDRTNESPREEAVRRIHLLGVSADAKNPDTFAEHLADKVMIFTAEAPKGKEVSRDDIKKSAFWGMLKGFDVTVAVADFAREDVQEAGDSVEISFVGKGTPRNMQTFPFYLRGKFTKQADGSYKLTALRVYDFLNRNNLASIPNFP